MNTTHGVTLEQAQRIVQGALAHAREKQFKPMGVVVLDASGDLVAFAREDGASMFRFDIARGKAWGAVGFGASSRALAERARDNPNFFVTLAATAQGKFLPQTGAVLIQDEQGQVLGAAGASGGTGDEDEAICAAGVQAAGLRAG
ncbi:MAG: heme-binding protein [Proteobacteria bacterium]|nr:heme-binding protein [Pseudomonadota bacterium]MDA0869878.1 heme-binding protein [Pseudomonadota bacterium]MDA1328769.1 heme-binding protein [Pseudomonadota bacterium]